MRYADYYLDEFIQRDFVARRRIPTLIQFSLLIVAIYAVVFVTGMLAHSFGEFAFVVLALFAVLNGVMMWNIQRSRDLLLITEFQNAIFSSALGVSNAFCLIVRGDGAVVHADDKFRAMFPQIRETMRRHLSELLGIVSVSKQDIRQVQDALGGDAAQQFVISMQAGDGKAVSIVLSVDPLATPRGFFLLRGRLFVDKRSA